MTAELIQEILESCYTDNNVYEPFDTGGDGFCLAYYAYRELDDQGSGEVEYDLRVQTGDPMCLDHWMIHAIYSAIVVNGVRVSNKYFVNSYTLDPRLTDEENVTVLRGVLEAINASKRTAYKSEDAFSERMERQGA